MKLSDRSHQEIPMTLRLILIFNFVMIACQAEITDPSRSADGEVAGEQSEPDDSPPKWKEGATLRCEHLESGGNSLRWPPAIDNNAISRYEVSEIDEGMTIRTVVTLDGSMTSLDVISRLEEVHYQVIAMDDHSNRSSPLTVICAVPPSASSPKALEWPPNSHIRLETMSESSVMISWPLISSDTPIRYTIFNGQGEQIVTQEDSGRTELSGLRPRQRYTVYVDAVDQSGRRPRSLLSESFETSDETAPHWPENAELSARVSGDSVLLSWPQAQDEGGVLAYELWSDSTFISTLSALTLTSTVPFLGSQSQSSTIQPTLNFKVIAIDHGALRSEPLSVDFDSASSRARDELSWPQDAALLIDELDETALTLYWSASNGPVSGYRVYQEGRLIAELEPTMRRFRVEGLTPLSAPLFSVNATREDLSISEGLALVIRAHLPDVNAPIWVEDSVLSLSSKGDSWAIIEWPMAIDLGGVRRYLIYLDGTLYGQRSSTQLWARLGELAPWSQHRVEVYAEDHVGHRSAVPLNLTLRTRDVRAPWWATESVLSLNSPSPTALSVSWPMASDDVGVSTYQVRLDGELITTMSADESRVMLFNDLRPWDSYTVSVNAVDEAGNVSQELIAEIQQPDPDPPFWTQGSEISIDELSSRAASLSWPVALDLGGVDHYVIYLDGEQTQDLVASRDQVIRAELLNLAPGSTILAEVFAVDRAGLRSTPLMITIRTPDGARPTWPNGARLVASAGVTEVHLSWPMASDDVGVVSYEVYEGERRVATLDPSVSPEVLIGSLLPEQSYLFEVYAIDHAEKRSIPISAEATTGKAFDPGFRRLTKEQVMRSLADLHGFIWQRGCLHPAHGENGCSQKRTSEQFYQMISNQNWGSWLDFRRAYPNDETISPEGEPRGGYKRFDQLVYPEHIVSWVSGVKYLANDYDRWIGADWIVLRPCKWERDQGITQFESTEAMHRACLAAWVDDFAPRAMRRPITLEERADFLAIYDEVREESLGEGLSLEQLFAKVVSATLFVINLQPEFLYHIEIGDESGSLTPYELANRLSYHFWNTMPDQALMDAAADGSLMTEAGFEAQVERLFADPRVLRSVEGFYRDYFRVESLPDINAQDGPGGWANLNYHTGPNQEEGVIPHYNNTSGANGNITTAMSREMINLGAWYTYHQPDSYEAMFRSNLHFLECSPYVWNLEQCTGAGPWSIYVYGVNGVCTDIVDCNDRAWSETGTGWDGISEPIELPQAERAGLVTRMPMLVHNTLAARPIRRGLNIREMLLCDPVPPPENCDVVKPPAVEGRCVDESGLEGAVCKWDQDCQEGESCVGADSPVSMTVREKVEALTEQPGTSCAGCHSTYINGFGHALNHFSSLGQYWEKEHMFTNQRNGNGDFWWFTHQPDRWRDIDASGTTLYQDQWVSLNGAHDLRDFLVETGRLEWCWSREYFRYSLGRVEWSEDEESVEAIAQALRDQGSLAEAFKAITNIPAFHRLYKPPTAEPNSHMGDQGANP